MADLSPITRWLQTEDDALLYDADTVRGWLEHVNLGLYILDGHTPVHVDDVEVWARWREAHRAALHVRDTWLPPGVRVSTVFLGVDHNFARIVDPTLTPILFETMVFGGPLDQEQERCATWAEAETQHAAVVARVRRALTDNSS